MHDERLSSPAVARNREPLREVLARVLPTSARVLEIASGSGEHACYFTTRLPGLIWQPTDPDPQALASIQAWRADQPGVDNPGAVDNAASHLLAPLKLDVTQRPWPDTVGKIDALVCINMIHIAPWAAAQALFAEAGERLPQHGPLVLYGPFRRHGEHTAPSNTAFDHSLQARDSRWGIRDLESDVVPLAEQHGLTLDEVIIMPANNLSVVLRRR
ncbi:DUF938 domain-containing protein [Kushneria phosphatilytica]|uniref:DUF938 domain-containing protein n=1 Tax=Kushneria phosphatilytica TaxID=657387 RepID=A0A1S1NT40_9GAMM|nr:DUF938 domain-containing protein [Kushneria phosphatilytica]OHV08773.1 SAM-dependent methyltransferase [Kushneria phosphatilytica]QEL12494.1 DUF938 domain-containing protein [Kushneria phosphatilytica]